MSKCMTIADESIDQRDTCREIAPKEIVEFVLEEILLSALIISDKGCSRIGDFNITEDFCQQYDRPQYLRDFEQVNYTGNPSLTNQESSVNSEKSADRPAGLVTAKENLELIIDSFVKKEGKSTPGGECTIISEEVLADNELQIQNGQSHIEKNDRGKSFPETAAREYFDKKDVIRDEKIEIQYYNEGKLSKIYVPLIPSNRLDTEAPLKLERVHEKTEGSEERKEETRTEVASHRMNSTEDTERPFQPFTTEEFRQVWKNINSSLVGSWDGDVSAKREEIGTLMEKLSSVQVFSDASTDPSRPRACAFGEEDVKKIIKEIEEISFTQSRANSEDFDQAYHPDGQGDADLESRSFVRSKDNLEKASTVDRPQEELPVVIRLCDKRNSDDFKAEESEVFASEKSISNQSLQLSSEKMFGPEEEQWTLSGTAISLPGEHTPSGTVDLKMSSATLGKEPRQASEEESLVNSTFYNDISLREDGCATQIFEPTFSADLPPERMRQTTESLFGVSYSQSKEGTENTTDSLLTTSEVLNEKEQPLWKPSSGNKEDRLTNNFEVTSEIDVMRASESVKDIQDQCAELNRPMGLSLSPANIEGNSLETNSDSGTEFEGNGTNGYPRKPDSSSDWGGNHFGTSREEVDSYGAAKAANDGVRDCCGNTADLAILERKLCEVGRDISDEKKTSVEGTNLIFNKSLMSERWSQKSLNDPEESDDKDTDPQFSTSTLTPSRTEDGTHSLTESEIGESSDPSNSTSQTFKLHSQKMYLGVNYESDSQTRQECVLTESEEAFIDETESVLQIIEPQEHSEDENSSKVSFSLLCGLFHGESSALADQEPESELSSRRNCYSEFESPAKKVYSGMTTVGPIKNSDYDPKDLTIPNIDYGKMTRITSSRQLAKEIDMFGSELTSTASVKIVEEDSDNDLSLNLEDDQVEFTSLVNRDIASLTKVQKVREVMSHHPKPEDDFEDEDALPRPRLDLKDVESMTDERYKVPDVNIPLLSLEIGDSNIGAEKELIENMGLVLSSLTNPVCYDEDRQEDNLEIKKSESTDADVIVQMAVSASNEDDPDKETAKTVAEGTHQQTSLIVGQNEDKDEFDEGENEESTVAVGNIPSQHDSFSSFPKYGTLGSVFRKASNKFIRRDGDLFLRNSKSLPRETAKITATDSIRSILDDCQSSASNMLKKSKSLLKNTQSIFKSMSSSRVGSERDSGHNVDKKKLSPSESDVSTLERKLSCFLKKEEFAKAKNLIKSKVEKTLKNFDSGNSVTSDKVSVENKDFRVAIRDEEKMRVDRMENFRKLLPKSPLVYKSQFVKSQMSMQNNTTEPAEVGPDRRAPDGEQNDVEGDSKMPLVEGRDDVTSADKTESQKQTCTEIKIPLLTNQQWSTDTEKLRSSMSEESEPQQLDYIIMETIQGLPTTDLESPSNEKENVRTKTKEQVDRKTGNEDMKKTVASNSVQSCADGGNDVAPCFPELDEEKMATKTPSERKIKTKKKKLTARIRSFWSSAFGRVKTSPKKGDLS